jgi:hypothetical protein
MKYIGWYSAASDKKFGHAIYLDKDGLEIKITEVISDGKKPLSKWNDLICVGEVDKCIKTLKVDFNRSVEELLTLAREGLAEQIACQKQFANTNKCFCHTCPLKYFSN